MSFFFFNVYDIRGLNFVFKILLRWILEDKAPKRERFSRLHSSYIKYCTLRVLEKKNHLMPNLDGK